MHFVETETSTRQRVASAVGEHGPVSASGLASRLGLTAAAVRRHLDAMLADGTVSECEHPPTGPRGRGRPAREFVLTDRGHAAMTAGYDDLAVSALRYLEQSSGGAAVAAFADARVAELERRYAPVVARAGSDSRARADALAGALSADGYAASTRPVAGAAGTEATQLCQGHCPVQHVAAEFPQLCEAETRAFSRLLGVHVQRLATLAGGAHVCTTHVPGRTPAGTGQPARTLSRTPAAAGSGAPARTTDPQQGRTRR